MIAAYHELIRIFKVLGWAGTLGISLGLAVGSMALAAAIIVRWAPNHFKGETQPPFWIDRPHVVRIAGLVAKNVAGYVLAFVGVVMALPGVPGQGVLMILIGLTLVNFPGKRRLEIALIRRPSVLRAVNMLRKRFGRPALEID